MTAARRWQSVLPLLAVLGSVTALGIGTSFAKHLFPLIGSMGTTAVRVAAVSSAVPISLEMVALKSLPKESFGIMASMEPAVAALLGLLVLDEQLTGLQWLAIVLTMLAAAGSSFTAQRGLARSASAEVMV